MKFEEFLILSDTLKEQNLSIADLKEDPEMINEVFGIRKHLVSWGIKEIFAKQLKNIAKKLNSDLIKQIQTSTSKLIASKHNVLNKFGDAEQIPLETQRQIGVIERKIVETINNLADKLSRIKTDQIDAKIDSSKLKETHKAALKYYWQTLIADVKINALTALIKQKVVENPELQTAVESAITTKRQKLDAEGEKINKQIEEETKEAEDDKDTAIEDKNDDGNAEKIDTPWINKFTIKGSNSEIIFKATDVHDEWRRVFEIIDVKGDFKTRGINNHWMAVFNQREIELKDPVRIDFYDRQGEYVTSKNIKPTELTNWEIIEGSDMNYGNEYDIPAPPADMPEEVANDAETSEPTGNDKIKENILKIKFILNKELKSDKPKEEKMAAKKRATELVKKLASQIKADPGYPDSMANLIDLMEQNFKGSISLFPEYKPKVKQSIVSQEDEEIMN